MLPVAVLLVLAALQPRLALAQAPRLTIHIGFQDRFKLDGWAPVTVLAENLGPSVRGTLEAKITTTPAMATLEVSAYSADDQFLNDLRLTAVRTRPGQERQELTLEQVAPGAYRASFPAPAAGEEIFTITGSGPQGMAGPLSIGYAVPYTREFQNDETNARLLRDLSLGTGGAILQPDGNVGDHLRRIVGTGGETTGYRRLWRLLALIALGLLLADIAVRLISLPEPALAVLRRVRGADRGDAHAEYDYQSLAEMIRARK